MAYEAIICKLKNVRPHPQADKLQLATVQGYQIIVGLNQKEDDFGIFFPVDGALSKDYCLHNNLYRKHPDTGQEMGGYFDPNGRVKPTKLRGMISEGFWQPIESLSWTGDVSQLKESQLLDTVNGYKICQKYYTHATLKVRNKNRLPRIKKKPKETPMFPLHFDTKQVRHNIGRIPEGSIITYTCKMHGTSGRTGFVPFVSKTTKFRKLWNKFMPVKFPEVRWDYVSGTRKVTLEGKDNGYYGGTNFRQKIHERIKSVGLYKNEVLYYEIVGFTDLKKPIMGEYRIKDKVTCKLYGSKMVFSYSCDVEKNPYDFYIYRITHVNHEGVEIDLSWPQVVKRCNQLGFKHVFCFGEPEILTDKQTMLNKLKELSDGPDPIDKNHVREGVVIRVEHPNMIDFLKWKGETYCEIEGIAKNDPKYVDIEEIS